VFNIEKREKQEWHLPEKYAVNKSLQELKAEKIDARKREMRCRHARDA
jgi:hypothetical protein